MLRQGPIALLVCLLPLLVGASSPFDLRFYDLEVQFNAQTRRVAGTQRMHVQAVQPATDLVFCLAAQLRIVELTFEGKALAYERQGDTVRARLPRRLPEGSEHVFQLLYGGEVKPRPAHLREVWGQLPAGGSYIGLREAWLAPQAWWPVLDPYADPADSMQVSVICEAGEAVVLPGYLRLREELPGQFRRWTYSLPYSLRPDQFVLYIGPFVEHTLPTTLPLRYYAPYGQTPRETGRVRDLSPLVAALEQLLGPRPQAHIPLLWVETGAGSNSPDLTPAVVRWWIGDYLRLPAPEDQWLLESLQAYVELMLYEQRDDRETVDAHVAAHCATLSPGAVSLHLLRYWLDNDLRWAEAWQQLCGHFGETPQQADGLLEYFQWKLGIDIAPFLHAPDDAPATTPTLEYALHRKKRRLTIYYRWDLPCDLPVELALDGERLRLQPQTAWQSLARKGISARELTFAPGYCLYRVEEVGVPK
ncbi:MAG: hypothetical protein OHK0039_20630 [Bacteroidia bacterium]